MNLVYNVQDKPKIPQLLIFALQPCLAQVWAHWYTSCLLVLKALCIWVPLSHFWVL